MSEIYPETPAASPAPVTPGQAAYEAHVTALDGVYPDAVFETWGDLPDSSRAAWEAAAQAVLLPRRVPGAALADAPVTPGRAFWAGYASHHPYGIDATPYDEFEEGNRAAIEEGAQAVLDRVAAQTWPELTAERDKLRAGLARAREELATSEEETVSLRVVVAETFALVAVLADGKPAVQRKANELRKRAGLLPSPDPVPDEPAPELAAAMAETRKVRAAFRRLLSEFSNGKGDGYRARLGQVAYRRYEAEAGPEDGGLPRRVPGAALEDEGAPYPRKDGDFTAIGPECFADADERVICWRGENYYRREEVPDPADPESLRGAAENAP